MVVAVVMVGKALFLDSVGTDRESSAATSGGAGDSGFDQVNGRIPPLVWIFAS